MSDSAELLAFGDFAVDEQVSLQEAAAASSITLHTARTPADASSWLDEHSPCALLLGGTGGEPLAFALGTRAQARHRKLPILALTREPSDLEFTGAFSWGADDVVAPHRSWSLTTRLRAVSRKRVFSDLPPRGTALVAEIDQSRRVATARVLSNAGFEVRFAVTPKDARDFALEKEMTLVVACTELIPEPRSLIEESRLKDTHVHFIISSEPKRFGELTRDIGGRSDTRVTDASAPPENVVFLANELAAGTLADKRTSVRHLYGTTVRFRPEGYDDDELGFTYNVSAGGLYVRTLAPPTEDLVWLELTPPRTARRVRLIGQVAWRRPFGPNGHATVPPGFGVRIVDGSKMDLERWQLAFEPREPYSLAKPSEA